MYDQDLLREIRRIRRLAVEAAVNLCLLEQAAEEVAHQAEVERLRLLWQAMRPNTPPLVPDHVPEEWVL